MLLMNDAEYEAFCRHIDDLATKCELERTLPWDHPERAEAPFEGGWMEIADETD